MEASGVPFQLPGYRTHCIQLHGDVKESYFLTTRFPQGSALKRESRIRSSLTGESRVSTGMITAENAEFAEVLVAGAADFVWRDCGKKEIKPCRRLLPTRLSTRPKGLEPSTFGSTVRCSIQLSYGPMPSIKKTQYYNRPILVSTVFVRNKSCRMRFDNGARRSCSWAVIFSTTASA